MFVVRIITVCRHTIQYILCMFKRITLYVVASFKTTYVIGDHILITKIYSQNVSHQFSTPLNLVYGELDY